MRRARKAAIRSTLMVLALVATLAFPRDAEARDGNLTMAMWQRVVVQVRRLALHPPVDTTRTSAQWALLVAWEAASHAGLAGRPIPTRLLGRIVLEVASSPRTQSIGRPHCGTLGHATALPEGFGYHVRHPLRVWGTRATVAHLTNALHAVTTRHPDLHALAIGDLSMERGGPLPNHRSHQSGRDVDIGLYHRLPSPTHPEDFTLATQDNLDLEATWVLIEAIAKSARRPGGVQYILLDHEVQRWLYDAAVRRGVPKRRLKRILQYPRAPDEAVGLVRHFPGHEDHMHVRYRCPPNDRWCIP